MLTLNLGIRAHDLGQLSLEELCKQLRDYQFTNIQFAIKKSFPDYVPSFQSLSPGIASFFGDYFANNGIKISTLGCYVNISSRNLAVRHKALNDFKTHIQLARDFRASLVGTETGSVSEGFTPENFTEEAYQIARSSVLELVEYAEYFGITVGIEAGFNHPLYSAPLAKRLIDEVQSPHLKIILDIANLINVHNVSEREFILNEALDLLHDHIAMIHLKDFTVNKGKIEIVPVGKGMLNFEPILTYLKYDRPFLHATLEETQGNAIGPAITHIREMYHRL